MLAAAGITLVEKSKLNPLKATSYGVGEMIADAVGRGCRKFIIGIGGSATNDGGIGMLQAPGYELLDSEGKQVPFGAQGLESTVCIRENNVLSELSECEFKVACDVENGLCGQYGCSTVFGPQKGATEDMIRQMDQWLMAYEELTKTVRENADGSFPGTGAAGGLGFALLNFLSAELVPGVDLVLEETHLENFIKESDIVVTGEGRLDSQTIMGKAPIGVAKMAKKHGKLLTCHINQFDKSIVMRKL